MHAYVNLKVTFMKVPQSFSSICFLFTNIYLFIKVNSPFFISVKWIFKFLRIFFKEIYQISSSGCLNLCECEYFRLKFVSFKRPWGSLLKGNPTCKGHASNPARTETFEEKQCKILALNHRWWFDLQFSLEFAHNPKKMTKPRHTENIDNYIKICLVF